MSKQPARAKSDKTQAHEKRLEGFHERLVAHPENADLDPELAKLVDSLLDFYRRTAKPQWWALFDRREAELEELLDEPEVIAGLYSPEYVGEGVLLVVLANGLQEGWIPGLPRTVTPDWIELSKVRVSYLGTN